MEILNYLPETPVLAMAHSPVTGELARALAERHAFVAFVHQPLQSRNPAPYRDAHLLAAVSRHIIASLDGAGLAPCHPEPLYGIADVSRLAADGASGPVVASSPYDWDRRKARDRLLSFCEPLWRRLAPPRRFERRPGITLGIVSRIAGIKQFPALFRLIAPVIARVPGVNLEVFGSGGYASIRDLRRELAPIAPRVRFWGHQDEVRKIYPLMDYLLTGLPEREGLGLNLVEAQHCGTPVLAVAAPPFTETVIEGATGRLFRDPREDGGADFERVLRHIAGGAPRPDPRLASAQLAEFAFPRFKERVAALIAALKGRLAERCP